MCLATRAPGQKAKFEVGPPTLNFPALFCPPGAPRMRRRAEGWGSEVGAGARATEWKGVGRRRME